ncbi:hypothetical protein D9Y95_RS13705 [Enterococcus hirae]
MFYGCSNNLTSLDLSTWDMSKVTNMSYMFYTVDMIPLLIKTSDEKLKQYNYSGDHRNKFGTVKVDATYGAFNNGQTNMSLFDDYTTDRPFNDDLINAQLEKAKKQLKLNSTAEFDDWKPEKNYLTFLEKANGIYDVRTILIPDCSVVIPTTSKLSDNSTLSKASIYLLDKEKLENIN